MAARQQFALPAGFEAKLRPWIEGRSKADDWANAREMRTLLEKTREAQALRIANDPSADISHVTIEDIILATGQKPEESKDTAAAALEKLDAMVGLAPVKQEVKRLTARLEVEQKRREQGLPIAARQPAHGVHRTARRRQDRSRARDRRGFPGAESLAQGTHRGD